MPNIPNTEFNLFKKEVKKWLKIFGVKDYDVYFLFENLYDDTWASCAVDTEAHSTIFRYNTKIDEDLIQYHTNERINKTALHEVLELIFNTIDEKAKYRYIKEDEIDTERHRLIELFCNVLIERKG